MCTAYWTVLDVPFTCPSCGAETSDDLQTHWMGDWGSMFNRYKLGQPVEELADIGAATPRGEFSGRCGKCQAWIDFDVRVESGAVVEVWPFLRKETT